MKRFAEFIFNHRGKTAMLLILITIASAMAASRVRFDEDPLSTIRGNNNDFSLLEELGKDFGSDHKDLLIVFGGDDLFTPQVVEILRETVEKVGKIEGVASIDSLAGMLRSESLTEPLLPPAKADPERLARSRSEAMAHPCVAGHLLSSDGKTMLMIVALDEDITTLSQFENIVDKLRAVTRFAARDSDLSIRVTGLPAIWADTLANARREALRFTVFGAAIAALIAMLLFRRLWAVLITVAGPVIGVIWSIGAMGLMGETLNGLNAVIPALLLVVGFADAVHLMIDIRFSLASGRTRTEAARAAVRHVGPGCGLASLTTALAFASLMLAETELVRRFGMVCSYGAILMFLAVIIVVPLLTLSRFGDRVLPRNCKNRGALKSPWLRHLAQVLLNYPRSLSVAGIGITGLLLVSALQLRPESSMTEFIPDDSETSIALDQCDEAFGGANLAYVVVQWPENLPLLSPEVMEATSAVHDIFEAGSTTTAPLSVLNLLQSLPVSEPTLEMEKPSLQLIPPETVRRFVCLDRQRLLVSAHVPNIGSSHLDPAFSELDRELAKLEDEYPGFKFHLTGTCVVTSRNVYASVRDLGKSLGLAAVLVFGIIALAFRSLRLGLISIVPNAFPLLLTASLLAWTGHYLRVASVVSFSLCLGLAVNDTIHFLMRFRRELRSESDVRLAIVRSMDSVGLALVTTTLILGAGFAVMMFSFMPAIRDFASFCLLAIVAALIGDLLFLPPLLNQFASQAGPSEAKTGKAKGVQKKSAR